MYKRQVVAVPDRRLDVLAKMYDPDKYTPAIIEFVDIAGLVKGASKGEGLGNKFPVSYTHLLISVGGKLLGIDSHHLAEFIYQRAAGVTRADSRIRLNKIHGISVGRRTQGTVQPGNNPLRN